MAIELHPVIVKTLRWPDEEHTAASAQALARALIPVLQAPEGSVSVALRGDLGAGKTTFVRHLLRALGIEGRIKSPTYAVVESYTVAAGAAPLNIWHFDFYRFNDPDEWEEAGFRDIFASPGLKLVEWPDKAGPHLPQPDLGIHIEMAADDARQVNLQAFSPAGKALLSGAE